MKGDMIEAYKIINDAEKVSWRLPFVLFHKMKTELN